MIINKNNKSLKKRNIFYIYLTLMFIVLARFYYFQVYSYENWKLLGDKNSIHARNLKAPRGIIYDCDSTAIVDNKFIYDINIIPANFDENNFNYGIISNVLDINRNFIDSIVVPLKKTSYRVRPHIIKRHIDFKTKSILDENKLDLKGMYFSKSPIRTFTDKSNLSHVIGYLRQDRKTGKVTPMTGIELKYNDSLIGKNGVEYHLVDHKGIDQGLVKSFDHKAHKAIQGNNLYLSIDLNLQEFVENLILGEKGSIIVSDSETGEVRSMFSFPDFTLDSFIGPMSVQEWNKLNNNSDNVFLNRSIQSTYSPGSIFKLILASIAIQNKIVPTNYKVNCTGVYDFFDTKFRCWKEDGHGVIDLDESIQKSCNVYYYHLMQKIDFDLWSEEVEKFGFGKATLIDLFNEKKGLVPNRVFMNNHYKNSGGWSKGHLLNLAIGQGETSVTPIQINGLISIIANEGYSFSPHINKNIQPIVNYVNYDSQVWSFIKKSMYNAVNKNGGTAYNARISNTNAKVYGKTGTVQTCSNCDRLPHAWFAGFLELKNGKRYTLSIIIENGGKGSDKPSRLAKKIFEFIAENDI